MPKYSKSTDYTILLKLSLKMFDVNLVFVYFVDYLFCIFIKLFWWIKSMFYLIVIRWCYDCMKVMTGSFYLACLCFVEQFNHNSSCMGGEGVIFVTNNQPLLNCLLKYKWPLF